MAGRYHGFTLVEMVLVVAIVGVLAAIAMPRLGTSTDSARVDVACRRLMADVALLRLGARASSSTASITFSTTDGTYTLAGVSRSGQANPVVNLAGAPFYCAMSLPGNATAATISYTPDGIPSTSLNVSITSGRITRTISVDPASGAAVMGSSRAASVSMSSQ